MLVITHQPRLHERRPACQRPAGAAVARPATPAPRTRHRRDVEEEYIRELTLEPALRGRPRPVVLVRS